MPEGTKYQTLDINYLKRVFADFDKDGSGYLEAAECAAALSKIGSKLSLKDLDTDGDNRISFEEFSIFSELVGKHTHPIFKGAQTNIDTSGASKTGISVFTGGAADNPAFLAAAAKSWRKLGQVSFSERDLSKTFQKIDIDGDGYLDAGEIRLAIKNVAPTISEMDITLMLATCDTDRDGKITYEEWKTVMCHDHANDVPHWERYGERDMMVGLKDRRQKATK